MKRPVNPVGAKGSKYRGLTLASSRSVERIVNEFGGIEAAIFQGDEVLKSARIGLTLCPPKRQGERHQLTFSRYHQSLTSSSLFGLCAVLFCSQLLGAIVAKCCFLLRRDQCPPESPVFASPPSNVPPVTFRGYPPYFRPKSFVLLSCDTSWKLPILSFKPLHRLFTSSLPPK